MSERVRVYCLEDTARYVVDPTWEQPDYVQGYTVDVDLPTAELLLAGGDPRPYRTSAEQPATP